MNEFTLRLAMADLALLDEALGAMPYKRVAHLIARINAQLTPQQQPQKREAQDEPKPDG